MNKCYTIKEHGDLLEQNAASFIETSFPNYERLWQIYVGNNGKGQRAKLPNYPFENIRQLFSENTYTVLESLFLSNRLIKGRFFEFPFDADPNKYFDYLDNLLLLFTHIGRIRDNLKKAATRLNAFVAANIESQLAEFYGMRHVVVHGQKIPIIVDKHGRPKIPKICSDKDDPSGWNDRVHNWDNAGDLEDELTQTSVENIFSKIVVVANNLFGQFYSHVKTELSNLKLSIEFEQIGDPTYIQNPRMNASGVNYSSFDLEGPLKYINSNINVSSRK